MRGYLVVLALLLDGCVASNSPQAIAEDQALCQQLGSATQEQMFQCVQNRQAIRAAEDMRQRNAMMVLGQQMQQQSRPTPVSRTTCRPFGDQMICDTF